MKPMIWKRVVIVDELPESCINVHDLELSCDGLRIDGDGYWCIFMDLPISPIYDPLVERPKWCPLELKAGVEHDPQT